MKVLIIDDDPDIAEVAKLVLEDEGYTVWIDHDGDYFERTNDLPDLVLLDLLIEGNSGEVIASRLKRNPRTQHIPVIIVSAHTPNEVKLVAQRTRADGFITKPFDIDQMVAMIKRLSSS